MAPIVYETYDQSQISDTALQQASQVFSEHYGVWSKEAAKVPGDLGKGGSRARASKNQIRTQLRPDGAHALTLGFLSVIGPSVIRRKATSFFLYSKPDIEQELLPGLTLDHKMLCLSTHAGKDVNHHAVIDTRIRRWEGSTGIEPFPTPLRKDDGSYEQT